MSNSVHNLNNAKQALRDAETALENALKNEKKSIAQQQLRIAELAHEVRTPLNAVIGYAQILSEQLMGPLGTPEYKDYARTIHQAAFHLLQVCDGMLDEFTPDEKPRTLPMEEVDASLVVDSVVDLFSWMAKERGVTLMATTDVDFPKLRTDPTRLNQVLINLVSNAVKFTPRGGTVNVAARVDKEKGAMILVIQDNGAGMSEAEMVERLEPFAKKDGTSPHGDKGTGLGLAVVQRLIGELQGRMCMSSAEGMGTIISIELPLDGADADNPPTQEHTSIRHAAADEFTQFTPSKSVNG